MKIIYLFLSILFSASVWAQSNDTIFEAIKAYKNKNYQKVLSLLNIPELRQDNKMLYIWIESEYAVISKMYSDDVANFDFQRLEVLRQNIDNYIANPNSNNVEKVKELKNKLAQYPLTATDFVATKNQEAADSQLRDIKKAFTTFLKFDEVLRLVDLYSSNEYIPAYELAYHKAVAQYRKWKLNRRNLTEEDRKKVLEELKNYKENYSNKNILYDQVVKEAIREAK
jgi:hypothetical protein